MLCKLPREGFGVIFQFGIGAKFLGKCKKIRMEMRDFVCEARQDYFSMFFPIFLRSGMALEGLGSET